MAKVLFFCEVVLHPVRGYAYPAVEDVRVGPTGTFACAWTVTPFPDGRRCAIGIAEVDATQLQAIRDDTRGAAFALPANWENLTWGDVPAERQTAILNFLNNRGVDTSGVTAATTLPTIVNVLSHRLRAGRRLANLKNELLSNFGVS